jgi:hypothetical protein
MKKFTESVEESGSRDPDGNWVPETTQAKLRNKLSPFWTLSDILSNDEHLSKLLSSEKGLNILKDLAKQCESNKEVIIELIKKTNKDEN